MGYFFAKGAGSSSASATYLQRAESGTDGTSFTFAAQNLGTAFSGRKILVLLGWRSNTSSALASSVTVAGTGATLLQAISGATGGGHTKVELWVASVDAGTSGDIVISLPITGTRMACSLFSLTGSGTLLDYDAPVTATSVNTLSTSVDAPAGSVVILGMMTDSSASPTIPTLTERSNSQIASEFSRHSVASGDIASDTIPLALTLNLSAYSENNVILTAVLS